MQEFSVRTTLVAFLLLIGMASTPAQEKPKRGIVGQKAPEWAVSHWEQLPEGKKAVQIGDYKDKVLCLYFFQSW